MVDNDTSLPPDVQRPTPPVEGCECLHCDRARRGLPPTGDGGTGQNHIPVQRPTPPLTFGPEAEAFARMVAAKVVSEFADDDPSDATPPLTEEELAETEAYYSKEATTWYDPDIARLIAEVRQSRAK